MPYFPTLSYTTTYEIRTYRFIHLKPLEGTPFGQSGSGSGRRCDLVVSAFVSGSSRPGSSPDRGHYVVFLFKALYSHGASVHPCQVWIWVPASLMLGVTLWWTRIPSRGEQKFSQSLHAMETGISSGLMSHLTRMKTLTFRAEPPRIGHFGE